MKGVSAIIATILMLIITIGLAGTAYVYISGVLTARTAVTLSISDAVCEGIAVGDDMTIVVTNDGSSDALAADLTFLINGVDKTAICTPADVPARGTSVQVCSVAVAGDFDTGLNDILVVHPQSTGKGIAYC